MKPAPARNTCARETLCAVYDHGNLFDDELGEGESASGCESEDSVMGTVTRPHSSLKTPRTHACSPGIELRLYRNRAYGPICAYGSMFLTADCATVHGCFRRVCNKIQTDCSFLVFQLPEDMEGETGGVRVNRGSAESEATFERVLEIFRKAKQFPGEPDYRSVEVEVGLDISEESDCSASFRS